MVLSEMQRHVKIRALTHAQVDAFTFSRHVESYYSAVTGETKRADAVLANVAMEEEPGVYSRFFDIRSMTVA